MIQVQLYIVAQTKPFFYDTEVCPRAGEILNIGGTAHRVVQVEHILATNGSNSIFQCRAVKVTAYKIP